MKLLAKFLNRKEFSFYFVVGIFATAADWTTFTIAVKWLNLHYQLALVLALTMGGLTNYSLNKIFTFKCQSRQYGVQVSVFIVIALFTLLCSMEIMAILIKYLSINKVLARITTTGLMLLPNYLVNKHITFSKKIFTQS